MRRSMEKGMSGILVSLILITSIAAVTIPMAGGAFGSAKIGDFVWLDSNNNGIQDAGEPGIAGVTVNLYNCNQPSDIIATKTTHLGGGIYHGTYYFENVKAGDYFVEFVLPDGYTFTLQDQGGDDEKDSDANTSTGKTECFSIENGDEDLSWDAGLVYECGECDGKVNWLKLRYNGTIKDAYIEVVQKKDGDVVFSETVQPGGIFEFNGTDKKDTLGTEISLSVNDVLNTKIHTSCSQPIGPNMTFGDFFVVAGTSLNGGWLCDGSSEDDGCGECDGKVTWLKLTYNGTINDAYIEVFQKKVEDPVFEGTVQPNGTFNFSGTDKKGTLGTEISLSVNGTLNTKIHTSCSQPIGPNMTFGDFFVVAGTSLNGGLLCPQEDEDEEDDCECDGKVNRLELMYNGTTADAIIEVSQKDGDVVFSETVQPGGTFNFSGTDKEGTLGTEISLYVNGTLNTKIHTSCSQPIGPGLIRGDFVVLAGTSLNGGWLCPLL